MIFVLYLIVAAIVVFLSQKASEYVDLLDKKTKLSGAFIGGVLLSAVTSLPELFTSVSSTLFLDKPGLCMGNILGSDLFNSAALSVIILVCFSKFRGAEISKSHMNVACFVLLIYGVLFLNYVNVLNYDIFSVNIITLIIIALYIAGVRKMSGDESGESDEDTSALSVKQVVIRFVLVSIGIVVTSIIITFITDEIAERLNIGAGFAGALFLGVATSLPELASTIALFRIKNYNIAFGNIVGSNLFNFLILSIADVLYFGSGVYDFSDGKTVSLLMFGIISAAAMPVMIKFKNRIVRMLCPVIMAGCYILFLLV